MSDLSKRSIIGEGGRDRSSLIIEHSFFNGDLLCPQRTQHTRRNFNPLKVGKYA